MNPISDSLQSYFRENLSELSNISEGNYIYWNETRRRFFLTDRKPDNSLESRKLTQKIKTFSTELLQALGNSGEITASDVELAIKLKQAIAGKNGQGGLLKLAETCGEETSEAIKKINGIIRTIMEAATIPEERYSDEDWEKAILESGELPVEEVSFTKYHLQYRLTRGLNDFLNIATWSLSGLNYLIFGGEFHPSWNWWDKIGHFEAADLYLGAIPISKIFGRNDLDELDKLGIKAVLSVVEVFENNDAGLITSTITPEQWRQKGIRQLQLATPDMQTVPIRLIERGVEFIHWNLQQGRNVYVHCKAGRGRSFLVEACYLIKYHGMTAPGAFQTIKAARCQGGFAKEDPKWKTMEEYAGLYRPEMLLFRENCGILD